MILCFNFFAEIYDVKTKKNIDWKPNTIQLISGFDNQNRSKTNYGNNAIS